MKDAKLQHNVRGPVKSVETETSEFKEEDGRWVERHWHGQAVTFTREGRFSEVSHRNPDGTTWRTVHHYSEDGRSISTEHFDPQGAAAAGGVTFVYDEEGRLVGERVDGGESDEGVVREHTHYRYDESGKKIKEQTLEPLGADGGSATLVGIEGTDFSLTLQDVYRIETFFDEQDNPISARIYNREGRLASRIEIRRDEEGRMLEEVQYIGEVPPFSNTCNVALTEGGEKEAPTEEQMDRVAEEMDRLFSPGTEFMKQTHTYDEAGRLTEKKMTMAGMTAFHQQFFYDERGDKIEEIRYGNGGEVQNRAVYEREYDERGNWTKELISADGGGRTPDNALRPSVVHRRVITYY